MYLYIADLWSIGCVLLQMFKYESHLTLLYRIHKKDWLGYTKMNHNLRYIISALLKTEKNDRISLENLKKHEYLN